MPRLFDYDASRASLFKPCKPPFFNGWQPSADASLCAELARLAYCEGDSVQNALPAVSFRLVDEIHEPSGDGTYVFLAEGERTAVLAFRGTQPDDPTDIFDDARFLPVEWAAGGNVHAGFADALQRVWRDVQQLLGKTTRPVIVTGHSLGAALATLAASLVAPRLLVTFGSPRVGDAAFCESLSRTVEAKRYVDCCDIVCQIPPPLPYQHVGSLHYIDRDGEVQLDPPEWVMAGDQLAGHADYVRNYVWRPGTNASRSLADHTPMNYVSAIAGVP